MLGKLIKHEWKSNAKVGVLMLFLMVLITFFGWLAFQSPMWQSIGSETESSLAAGLADILSIFTLMIYVFMLVGVSYGIMIYFAVHFYKTMYTDQGYLIHTLPVTKHQILGSKILVSGIWYMIITLAICLSMVMLGFSLISAVIPDGYSLVDLWAEISDEMGEVWAIMKDELGFDAVVWVVYMIIAVFVSPFSTLAIMYSAITLGQLFTKHRVLMSIVSYIGISVVLMLAGSVLQGVTTAANYGNMMASPDLSGYGDYMNVTMLGALAINIVVAIILYFVSHHIIEKKLNME